MVDESQALREAASDACGGPRSADRGAAVDARLVRELLGGVSGDAAGDGQAGTEPERIVETLVEHLGLSGAGLSLARAGAEGFELESVAAAGSHASFARHLPSVGFKAEEEAAHALESAEAEFVGDAHGLSDAAPADGVGRWRGLVATSAYAVLPLVSRARAVGVLTLEWAQTRDFDAVEQEVLSAIADVVAVVLAPTLPEGNPEAGGDPDGYDPGEDAVAGSVTTFDITAEGHAVVHDASGRGVKEPVARLHVAAREPGAGLAVPVYDLTTTHPGTVDVALGACRVADGSGERGAEILRTFLRGHSVAGLQPDRAVAALSANLARSGLAGMTASVVRCRIDVTSRALSWAGTGGGLVAVETGSGRLDVTPVRGPGLPSSDTDSHTEGLLLLLPGDVVVLATACGSGSPDDLAAHVNDMVSRAETRSENGRDLAREVLGGGSVCEHACAAVIEWLR